MKLVRPSSLVPVLLAVISGILTGAPPTVDASDAAAAPTLLTGTLSDRGQPVRDGYVVALAWPNQRRLDRLEVGESGDLYPVAATAVGPDGTFTLTADPDGIPRFLRGPSGYVNLDIMAVSDRRQMELDVPLTPQGAPSVRASWRATAPGDGSAAAMHVSFDFGAAAGDLGLVLPESEPLRSWVEALSLRRGVSTHPMLPPSGDGARVPLPPPGCHYVKGSLSRNHKEHFTTTQTWWGAPETVTETTTADHTLGVAYQVAGHRASASGSRTISRQAHHSASTTYATSHQIFNRVNYREYAYPCRSRSHHKFVPESFYDILSDDGRNVRESYFFASCSPHAPRDTWDTGSATNITYARGVSILGIELSAQSGYGSSLNMHYRFKAARTDLRQQPGRTAAVVPRGGGSLCPVVGSAGWQHWSAACA